MATTHKNDELFDWPPWVPAIFGFLVLITGVAVVVQRQAAGQGVVRPGMFAGLVLLPYVLEIFSAVTRIRVALPSVLFPVPVLLGIALLLVGSTEVDFAPFVLVMLCGHTAAETEDRPIFGVVVTIACCALMVLADVFGQHNDSFIWVIGIAFGWFGGFSVQTLAAQTFALKRANAELEEKATTEERQRIAREVHDVIAHSLSVTMLHVTAARMALEKDEARTADALDALREAETQGRNSLQEIRRTVGLLGSDESATAAPMPGVADLPKLVSDFRAAGLDAALTISGSLGDLPPAAGLNLYRIIQESLTNAVKHAPGATVLVELDVGEKNVSLRVHNKRTNGMARNVAGLGLRGMAERAALLGGELAIDEHDGWAVSVVAPKPVA